MASDAGCIKIKRQRAARSEKSVMFPDFNLACLTESFTNYLLHLQPQCNRHQSTPRLRY